MGGSTCRLQAQQQGSHSVPGTPQGCMHGSLPPTLPPAPENVEGSARGKGGQQEHDGKQVPAVGPAAAGGESRWAEGAGCGRLGLPGQWHLPRRGWQLLPALAATSFPPHRLRSYSYFVLLVITTYKWLYRKPVQQCTRLRCASAVAGAHRKRVHGVIRFRYGQVYQGGACG